MKYLKENQMNTNNITSLVSIAKEMIHKSWNSLDTDCSI